jgi:5-methylcytosine-specific restriction endonuclease McrA
VVSWDKLQTADCTIPYPQRDFDSDWLYIGSNLGLARQLNAMHGRTFNSLIGYSLDTDLVDKIGRNKYTVALLRSAGKDKLLESFTAQEVETIKAKINRAPIEDDVLKAILAKSLGCCCYCNDGNSAQPYQIHHINPYSDSQDNSENNLMLVCPTHHVRIHTNGIHGSILT